MERTETCNELNLELTSNQTTNKAKPKQKLNVKMPSPDNRDSAFAQITLHSLCTGKLASRSLSLDQD